MSYIHTYIYSSYLQVRTHERTNERTDETFRFSSLRKRARIIMYILLYTACLPWESLPLEIRGGISLVSMSDRLRICMTHTTASDCLFFFFFSDPIHAQIMEEPGGWSFSKLIYPCCCMKPTCFTRFVSC